MSYSYSTYGYSNPQAYQPQSWGGSWGGSKCMVPPTPTPYMAAPTTSGYMMPQQLQGAAVPPSVPSGSMMTPSGTVMPAAIPMFEESYIENIFRLNLGKVGTFYMTYENNSQWNAKVFRGVLEAAGRDHIIISDPNTGQRIVMLMVNFDYATFDEPLAYQYPGVTPRLQDEA
ncbi:spore coat protein GerQ [Paenibacillus dendritiformis]|uniref:Spore coat protein GerQ n=1 Tax=Paenibacillus dendritiformis C454 TaxID=1131935 RepID=H3SAK1_9BACL|nr:spore coat protein GerQ [Paenibacillus dendritiformis C454]